MRKILSLGIFLVILVGVGCAEEQLVAYLPEASLSVDREDKYAEVATQTIDENEVLVIDLGEVPVYAEVKANVVVESTNAQSLRVSRVSYSDGQTVGSRWDEPTWRKSEADQVSKVPPFTVPGGGSRIVEIPFTPMEEGAASAMVEIESNAKNGKIQRVMVKATGIYSGEPEIELVYNGMVVPDAAVDCTDGVCVIPESNALDFGNIGLSTVGTAQIIIKNLAECEAYPGADVCSACPLIVDKNSSQQDIGVGFKPDTNTDGVFSFVGSTAVPFVVAQKNVDCGSEGQVKLLVSFEAPAEEGEHTAVIVIESNDADESVIEIPIRAMARNAPLAIGKIREFDSTNPSAPYTDPDNIEPLDRVYFDGRFSCDTPCDGTDPNGHLTLPSFTWEVIEAPEGADESDFAWEGADTALPSMWIPIAGHYVVRLTVRNASGIESGDTTESRVEFDAVPGSAMHIQLVWDHPTNDQDLHLVLQSPNQGSTNICHDDYDCYFSNCNETDINPVHWFTEAAASTGPNPRLDRDDTNGLGPENINIDEPNVGTYRVYVHYWPGWSDGSSATVNTLRIYLNGILRFDQHRTMTASEQVWAVADILWIDDGSDLGGGTVSVYPSPQPGQVGELKTGLTSSLCSSGTGIAFDDLN